MKKKAKLLSRAELISLPDDMPLKEAEAAVILGVTPRTLTRRRYQGDGPAYIRQGPRLIRYSKRSLLAWLNSRQFSSTTEEGFRGGRRKPAEATATA